MLHSVLFQILTVGFVSFTQPGIWNALNYLGAGGEEKPYLVNGANALTYGIMIIGCTLSGSLCNVIGVKWTLVLGVIFYIPYSSSLYCNNRFGIEWYVLFGAALCGIGASMFWASEAAIAVGYPPASQRGRMVAIWLALRNLGSLIGGAISLALNTHLHSSGKVSYTTYLVLIAIQCVGLPASLLLSPPHKVQRSDGTRVPHLKHTTLRTELRSLAHFAKSPPFLLLIPIFITGIWGTTYQSNYLTTYFSVRARALASLLTAIANILGDLAMGCATDSRILGSQASRARWAWAFLAVWITALWIWQTITQVDFVRDSTPVDWAGGHLRFNNAIAVLILWKFFYEAQLTFVYWIVGTFPHAEGALERTVGVLRTFESVGSCFSYVVGATHWPYLNQAILSFALWGACLIPTTLAVCMVPKETPPAAETLPDIEHAKDDSSEHSTSHEKNCNYTYLAL